MSNGNPMLPRIDPAIWNLAEWELCQVAYVTAKELLRVRPDSDWTEAYREGWELAEAINQSGRALTPSSEQSKPGGVMAAPQPPVVPGHDLVHWPTLVCSLNSYAQYEAKERAQIRQALSKGAALWEVGIGGPVVQTGGRFSPEVLCDPKALQDREYIPEPPCVPHQAATAGAVALASFVGASALALVLRVIRR